MNFVAFFEQVCGHRPYPYQVRVAEAFPAPPELVDIPTGLGKTAALVVGWLYAHLTERTTRRLIYTLPMRSLVTQTSRVAAQWCERAGPFFEERGRALPQVFTMMGGEVDEAWEAQPNLPAIIIGTQDLLISRALNRGFAMSRYRWPMHFGLLNNDATWVFDEPQVMGVSVETGAQLQGLREQLGTLGATRSIWMSATLDGARVDTVDHRGDRDVLRLDDKDLDIERVRTRTNAKKAKLNADFRLDKKTTKPPKQGASSYIKSIAKLAVDKHKARSGFTLVVLNRVDRAREVFAELESIGGVDTALVHSRFRPGDRAKHEAVLFNDRSRIVVATQTVEAGVDVSARTLISELAPWSSMVQRIGRCNRTGEMDDAQVVVIDADLDGLNKDADHAPYTVSELAVSQRHLKTLEDVGPTSLSSVDYSALSVVRPVLRRRDLLQLFDTTPDLSGDDIDVSRFVRDNQDTDVQFFWRVLDEPPEKDLARPARDELCRVSIGQANAFVTLLNKRKKANKKGARFGAFAWDPLAGSWTNVERARPGQVLLVDARAGGYDSALGFTGELGDDVDVVEPVDATSSSYSDDKRSAIGRWVVLEDHLQHVHDEAGAVAEQLELAPHLIAVLKTSGLWHDVGKAHEQFQRRLLDPVAGDATLAPPTNERSGLWAKSGHQRRLPKGSKLRPHFRHELASALAWLSLNEDHPDCDLVAFLVAAHHGKVRVSIRSVPGEVQPDDNRLFARGVWDGDEIECLLRDGTRIKSTLDLSPLRMGEGSWLSRSLKLRDDPALGPFRLALLETVLRVSDWRASAREQEGGYDD